MKNREKKRERVGLLFEFKMGGIFFFNRTEEKKIKYNYKLILYECSLEDASKSDLI